jgi:hypothetical protein
LCERCEEKNPLHKLCERCEEKNPLTSCVKDVKRKIPFTSCMKDVKRKIPFTSCMKDVKRKIFNFSLHIFHTTYSNLLGGAGNHLTNFEKFGMAYGTKEQRAEKGSK